MPSVALADLETITAVASTPAERLPVATLAHNSASSKAHFNASLDMALHILKQQDQGSTRSDSQSISGRGDSATPVNWASTDIEGNGSTLSQIDDLLSYSATPDDLILNTGARASSQSRSSYSSLSTTLTAAGEDTQAECQ
ncbi:hypothetical protein LPJ71_002719, partial [Coemansia sp. S17]